MDDKIRNIDARWHEVKPESWGENTQKSELEMLHVLLEDDELPGSMVKGTFHPEKPQRRDRFVTGIVVATNRRLVAVGADGILRSTTFSIMEYGGVSTVTHESGLFSASIRIDGPTIRAHRIDGIRDKNSVEPFVQYVLGRARAEGSEDGKGAVNPVMRSPSPDRDG